MRAILPAEVDNRKQARWRHVEEPKVYVGRRAGSGNLNNWDKCNFCLTAA